MLYRVEPVTTLFYLCAWYGIIWTLDRLIQWREGRSLIARCGPAFLLILFWSAVGWYAFELINFRLQNWYYIFVLDHPALADAERRLLLCHCFSRLCCGWSTTWDCAAWPPVGKAVVGR